MRQLDGPRPYRSAEADPQLWSSREEVRDVAEQRTFGVSAKNPIIKRVTAESFCACHQCHIERFITFRHCLCRGTLEINEIYFDAE